LFVLAAGTLLAMECSELTPRLGTLERERTMVLCPTVKISDRLFDLWFRMTSWGVALRAQANVCRRCGASCWSSSRRRSSMGRSWMSSPSPSPSSQPSGS
jgi:hypothetical protein